MINHLSVQQMIQSSVIFNLGISTEPRVNARKMLE